MAGQNTHIEVKPIRIIIVDDHAIVREGLRALLSRETGFNVCGDAGTVAETLLLIVSESPHVAIVDMVPDGDRVEDLIRKIKVLNPRIRILAYSMHDDLLSAERALAAGAMGYINQRNGIRSFIEAVRTVMAGEVFLSDRMKQDIINRSMVSGPIRQKTPIETLSIRELEIFRLIGQGLTTKEIGEQLNLSSKTIETHRQNIRRHLQLGNTHKLAREAAQWILENG